jgi:hypothetical protein
MVMVVEKRPHKFSHEDPSFSTVHPLASQL